MKRKDSIRYLKGIGEKRAALFQKLGITCVEDLLYHLPRGYEDRTDIREVADLQEGESVCVRVSPAGGIRSFRARTGARVTQIYMTDGSGMLRVTWFNVPYVEKQLQEHEGWILFGKVGFRGLQPEMINPVMEAAEQSGSKTGTIVPIYPCTAGLNQRQIREAVKNSLQSLEEPLTEVLPEAVRRAYHLMDIDQAIQKVHLPESFDEFAEARRRLAFEEFFIMQMGIGLAGQEQKKGTAPPIADVKCIAEFAQKLPFGLTRAQKRVINEISADLKREVPMNRLVQGDVGCGKTVVAASVMFAVVRSGLQAAMMAPTEILAKQHYATLSRMFQPWGIHTVLLTGGQKNKERDEVLAQIADGTAQVVVGTHALITKGVEFARLGLAITDEQHRFGVRQRSALSEKSEKIHTLVMTATPIPRTLSLILYGDLDISLIDELPSGRKKIKTIAVDEGKREQVNRFLLSEIQQGHRVYFICPLIEESEVIDANAVEQYLEELKKGAFRKVSVAALHGRMKQAEKDAVMEQFASGEIQALVSTTVVEVGVDVPEATVMVIENAERFGLSQLHQLRGRVGRGAWQSYCILFCNSGGSYAKSRMQTMCQTDDGFKIAEKDLELRGPGEFLGTRQHGLPQMRIGDLMTDMELLKEAQTAAATVLKHDPQLSDPKDMPLRAKIEENFAKLGGILN